MRDDRPISNQRLVLVDPTLVANVLFSCCETECGDTMIPVRRWC